MSESVSSPISAEGLSKKKEVQGFVQLTEEEEAAAEDEARLLEFLEPLVEDEVVASLIPVSCSTKPALLKALPAIANPPARPLLSLLLGKELMLF